jgi:hypothetical protein
MTPTTQLDSLSNVIFGIPRYADLDQSCKETLLSMMRNWAGCAATPALFMEQMKELTAEK